MDTTEELNGSYFYRGLPNLTPGELLEIIFLEEFCKELGIDAVTGAVILSGQPWLKTRTKPGGAIEGTSVISKYARIVLKGAKVPFGIRVQTPVGVRMKKTTSLAAVIARYVPWLGWAGLVTTLYRVSTRTQDKYNLIARPKDRIQWTSF
ncbi:STM2901 family protein [Scandinavium sp. NPDC088450]|uniref:STM2901 family protein n=1 Tax=Scandinavium sp. NPDC088450 TaxID=3364514 RepID=UPI00384C57B5